MRRPAVVEDFDLDLVSRKVARTTRRRDASQRISDIVVAVEAEHDTCCRRPSDFQWRSGSALDEAGVCSLHDGLDAIATAPATSSAITCGELTAVLLVVHREKR